MNKFSEKEKSSRKYRDDRDDKESTKDHQDRHRDRVHKNHRARDNDDTEEHHRRDEHRHNRRSDWDSRREGSHDDRDDREELDDRSRSRSYKRKDRGGSEDRYEGSDKKIRVSDEVKKEERREKRRFEDGMEDGKVITANKPDKEERRERRKFGDKVKEGQDYEDIGNLKQLFVGDINVQKEAKDGLVDATPSNVMLNGSGSVANGAAVEPLNVASNDVPSLDPSHILHSKVSSIYTPNENKGVSITRSHAVPGKSSTDGTSTAGKTGNLSLDALAKAKKALQMQKELSEKMKKIPLLNKGAISRQDGGSLVGSKEVKAPFSGIIGEAAGASALHGALALHGAATASTPSIPLTTPNFEAVKRAQELAAKMGFRQDPEFAPLINMFPGQVAVDIPNLLKPSKAPVLRLDALGREIDEHGNVVSLTKPSNLSTLKVNINKQKQEAFQILKPELEVDPESNHHFDERMGINKTKLLRPKRMTFQFVDEGKWAKEAEILKLKNHFGEAQAKELKAKQAQLAKAKAEPDINPNLIEVSERVIIKEKPKDPIPEIEWWDVYLLQSGYLDIDDSDVPEDKIKMEKMTIYIEHPLPIEPPAEPAPPPPQPLKLTKKELKKLRTQTRLAREKQKQEMIRDGVIPPPKQKVKMSNLMKVLGSEATQDPTRMEMEIRSAAAEREQAHLDRNIARKSTPSERREKKERKLFDDPNTLETTVSVYRINDLSHAQTKFKVDINAQENRLTGCAVISDAITVVVVEGGIKSIKRYGKLMLKRINWATAVEHKDEDDEDEMKPVNKCVLAWQGSVAKSSFNRFFVHNCRTGSAARKILSDAGVIHYWDLAVNAPDE